MKKVWLMGGFGNVLFQILAYNVISKTNKQVYYVNKLTENNWITRFLGWTIHQKLYNKLISEDQYHNLGHFNAISVIFVSLLSKKFKKFFRFSTFYSNEVQLQTNVSNNIFGYFQNSKFLKKNSDELLKLGKRLRDNYAYKSDLIVVHYRKGDSARVDSAMVAKLPYYYEKIKPLLQKEKKQILVVTDSTNDADVFFKEIDNSTVISSSNALDDFRHLVSAKKLYCAPSTFSWWAAHALCKDSEIVMPQFLVDNLGVYANSNKLTIV